MILVFFFLVAYRLKAFTNVCEYLYSSKLSSLIDSSRSKADDLMVEITYSCPCTGERISLNK